METLNELFEILDTKTRLSVIIENVYRFSTTLTRENWDRMCAVLHKNPGVKEDLFSKLETLLKMSQIDAEKKQVGSFLTQLNGCSRRYRESTMKERLAHTGKLLGQLNIPGAIASSFLTTSGFRSALERRGGLDAPSVFQKTFDDVREVVGGTHTFF